VVVRDYRAEDEDACRALFEELVDVHRRLYPDAEIGAAFNVEGRLLVAERAGEVVGFAGMLRHPHSVEIEPIVIAPGQRGNGVGRALVERVVEEARAEEGVTQVYAQPAGRNRDAFAFFNAVGLDVLAYVRLQLDLEPRPRRPGEALGDREFRV
jgi:N-acetylglutamate synthase-like GNAT family acetyltransferase